NIEMSVLEDQVVDHILSAANIEEVLANYADVISCAAIAPSQDDADGTESDEDAAFDAETDAGKDTEVAGEASAKDDESK
ncbi:MAG: hypothetical protein VXZ70_05085, partial [Pseudomonadota bacterium]|nr:hypothetical protein [Pseudomonadota bacterium]